MRGTYHAATSRRHTRTKPPMMPPITKFRTNRAAPPPREPPPGTIQTHIRWMPKGRPQSIQSQRRSSSPFLMQADLKIQYSSPAMATGKTAFLKNSLMASVLVIGGTSIPVSIIPGKSDRAQGLLKSPAKRTILPIPVRCSTASAVRPPSAFPAGPPHSGGGCRTPAPPAGPSDIPIAGRSFWR